MLALKHLRPDIKTCITPLIDIATPSKSSDQAQAEAYVKRNIDRSAGLVRGFPAVFIDSSELDPGFRLDSNVHPLAFAAQVVTGSRVPVIPVTGLHRDVAHLSQAFAIANAQDFPQVCIRLDETDVSTAALTSKRIRDLVSSESSGLEQIYLLFDLQCLWGRDIQAIDKQVSRLLLLLNDRLWAGIIVGGYGFPDQLSQACSTNDTAYLRRVEQDLFFAAARLDLASPIWFSDYSVLSPSSVELDFHLIRKVMAPKAMYTLDDTWFLVRGGAFSSHTDGYGQYFTIADEIIALAEFSGADFSYGDQYIMSRHLRNVTSGSPASWITACVNRHITFTAIAHGHELVD